MSIIFAFAVFFILPAALIILGMWVAGRIYSEEEDDQYYPDKDEVYLDRESAEALEERNVRKLQ